MNFNPLSYWARRQSSYHVLFASAIAGFCLLTLATIFTSIIYIEFPKKNWGYLFGVSWLVPSMLTLPLSLLYFLFNRISWYKSKSVAIRAARRRNDVLEIMFIQSLTNQLPVALSLKSGKIYIGYIVSETDTNSLEKKFISILPVLSGYRDPATKELFITTNYATTLEKLDFKTEIPYDIIIPIEEIETARFHDEYLFQGFRS